MFIKLTVFFKTLGHIVIVTFGKNRLVKISLKKKIKLNQAPGHCCYILLSSFRLLLLLSLLSVNVTYFEISFFSNKIILWCSVII